MGTEEFALPSQGRLEDFMPAVSDFSSRSSESQSAIVVGQNIHCCPWLLQQMLLEKSLQNMDSTPHFHFRLVAHMSLKKMEMKSIF